MNEILAYTNIYTFSTIYIFINSIIIKIIDNENFHCIFLYNTA